MFNFNNLKYFLNEGQFHEEGIEVFIKNAEAHELKILLRKIKGEIAVNKTNWIDALSFKTELVLTDEVNIVSLYFGQANPSVEQIALLYNSVSIPKADLCNFITKKCVIGTEMLSNVWKRTFGFEFSGNIKVELAKSLLDKDNNIRSSVLKTNKTLLCTPKLDGVRMYYSSALDAVFTRNNLAIAGLDRIKASCKAISRIFGLDIIDGEVYSEYEKFDSISGLVRGGSAKHLEEKEDLSYVIFAVIKDLRKPTKGIEAVCLLSNINEYIKTGGLDKISVLVPVELPANIKEIQDLTNKYVNEGYEGLMLRVKDKPYNFGRGSTLYKYKLFLEDDFVIVGTFEGKGKYEGMLGGFYIEKDGIKSKVGTGLTDEQRQMLWAIKNLLPGRIINVQYQGITEQGSLRFPSFLRFVDY